MNNHFIDQPPMWAAHLLIVLVLLLAACGGADPTATPTAAPPTADTASSGSYLDELEHVPDPKLIDVTWAWERRDNPDGSTAVTVPNPESYTLRFNADGSFGATLDCNTAFGRYATHDNGGIFMELGPGTLVACGEGSLANDMMGMFGGAVQDYRFEEDGEVLVFSWTAGGPVDYYRSTGQADLPAPAPGAAMGTVIAPAGIFLRTGPGTHYPSVAAAPYGDSGPIIGVSQDGKWWLADAPNLPGGQVWVAAEFVEAVNVESVPVVAAPSPDPGAPTGAGDGGAFSLVSFGPAGAEQPPLAGTQITVNFGEDRVSGNAGCNDYAGTLTPVADYFTISNVVTTRKLCNEPAGVMEQEAGFLTALEGTGGYCWEQGLVDGTNQVTAGQLFYALPDGTAGVINLVSVP